VSSEVHGTEWLSGTLRAWHLAMLRYAVTFDNADRLAVLRIAHEIDGLDPQQDGSSEFEFFRRTSAELCAAICNRMKERPRSCNNIWTDLTMTVSSGPLRRQSTPVSQPSRLNGPLDSVMSCGKGFPRAALIDP
jgi:hypothetical protein